MNDRHFSTDQEPVFHGGPFAPDPSEKNAARTDHPPSELERRLANTAMQILGLYGPLSEGAQAPFDGYMGWEYKFSLMQAVGGGSNEIERILIAIAGLGLPRP